MQKTLVRAVQLTGLAVLGLAGATGVSIHRRTLRTLRIAEQENYVLRLLVAGQTREADAETVVLAEMRTVTWRDYARRDLKTA